MRNQQLRFSIEVTSAKYASGCWRAYELCLSSKLRNRNTPDDIDAFVRAFGLARCFDGRGRAPDEKFSEVPGWLIESDAVLQEKGLVPAVEFLSVRLEKIARTENLSAASKLLWARHPDKGIIKDDRALKSLRKLSYFRGPQLSEYGKYVARFQRTKTDLAKQLATIVERLELQDQIGVESRLVDYWLYENNGRSAE